MKENCHLPPFVATRYKEVHAYFSEEELLSQLTKKIRPGAGFESETNAFPAPPIERKPAEG